jgi:hypothetical protein
LSFRLPPIHETGGLDVDAPVTLVAQSEGLSAMALASDAEPTVTTWRSTKPHQVEVVRLYQQGRSLTSIAGEVGIAWDSVARLLDRAGVRERKNKSRSSSSGS